MNKLIFIFLFSSVVLAGDQHYYGSTTAAVIVSGSIIKTKHVQDSSVKYKRKDCPVCKGKGWYMSGDGILKIDCTYCEADKASVSISPIISISPPKAPEPKVQELKSQGCQSGQCKQLMNRRK